MGTAYKDRHCLGPCVGGVSYNTQ